MPNVDSNQISQLTGPIIAAAIRVHWALGPGLLESAYSVCLLSRTTTIAVSRRRAAARLPVVCYEEVSLDCGYRSICW